jgi:hypothetical protein
VPSRPAPRDLRCSDADRERVITLLSEAAGDGRLTLGEHSERTERAYAARTLGELAELTADLAAPAAQPIRLDGRGPIAAVFGHERRGGRWVVPERLAVTCVFGQVVLDLREAMLQSQRVTVLATMLGGTLELIVPDEVTVVRTTAGLRGWPGGPASTRPGYPPPVPESAGPPGPVSPSQPVIEVRTFGLGGRVKIVRPRKSRWRGPFSRRRS